MAGEGKHAADQVEARARQGAHHASPILVALAELAARPFGPWLLGLTALGFVAYGLAEARFHRIAVA